MKSGETTINGNSYRLIAYGYCHCGCGEKTQIIKKHSPAQNRVKGEPSKYLHGHNGNLRKTDICAICKINKKEKRAYCNKCYSKQNCERVKKNRQKNPHKYRKLDIYYLQQGRINLSDRYIKDLITKRTQLKYEDVPLNLVALYRSYIKLHRMVRKINLKGEKHVVI